MKYIEWIGNEDDFWRIDERGMMVRYKWGKLGGHGDSLGRTAICYLLYGRPELLQGVLDCYEFEGEKVKVYRHPDPEICEFLNEQSRDHTIMSLAVLKIAGEEYKEIAKGLPIRISKFAVMTPDMYFWVKGLYKGQFYSKVAMGIVGVTWWFNNGWNRVIRALGGFKKVDVYDVSTINPTERHKWWRKLLVPEYARHFGAWMVFATEDSWFKRFAAKMMLADVEVDNYVIRGLLGGKVEWEYALVKYPGLKCWRWECRLDESLTSALVVGGDKGSNIDIDILKWFQENGI